MFRPPRCPYRDCSKHRRPDPRFFRRHGSYAAKCRPWAIPRYRCKSCRRTFSRQTFRCDYRDHRPDLNARLLRSIASGLGLRQTARNLRLSLRCTELKFRKIARHLRRLNLNLQRTLPENSTLQFDELETYEGRRNTRPLSVPVLIERHTRFIIWAEAAPIRPRGKMSESRERAIADDRRRFGDRRDLSTRSIRRALARGAAMVQGFERIVFESDEKSSYPAEASRAFGAKRLEHRRTSNQLARRTWNPLFPINQTEALARDLLGRLRRDSWLVSKKRRYLDLGLHVFMAYRNLVRKRFNHDEQFPAELLGFAPRRMSHGECLSWRQDWGRESIHPTSRRGVSIRSSRAFRGALALA